MPEVRRAYGFVRWREPGIHADLVWVGMDHQSRPERYCRLERAGWSSGELEQVLLFLARHRTGTADAWTILLELFPEDRAFLEAYLMDRLIHTMLQGVESL